jgi:hypothetical protein
MIVYDPYIHFVTRSAGTVDDSYNKLLGLLEIDSGELRTNYRSLISLSEAGWTISSWRFLSMTV